MNQIGYVCSACAPLLALTKSLFTASGHPSPVRGLSRKPQLNQAPPLRANSIQFEQSPQVTLVRGPCATFRAPRFGSRVSRLSDRDLVNGDAFGTRSFNREMLSTTHGSRSVDHGPFCLGLGPRTMVQGSGKVAGKVLTVDL